MSRRLTVVPDPDESAHQRAVLEQVVATLEAQVQMNEKLTTAVVDLAAAFRELMDRVERLEADE